MLLAAPLNKNESQLPSPEQLKRKIILKHKKLPDGNGGDKISITPESIGNEFDIASSVKNGILYIQDNELFEWKPHFFVLTDNKMFYSEVQTPADAEEEEENEDDEAEAGRGDSRIGGPMTPGASGGGQDQSSELHFSEPWFHRIVQNGRAAAVDLLLKNAHLGDGTFLVRPSETFVGSYSLSFLRKGEVRNQGTKQTKP